MCNQPGRRGSGTVPERLARPVTQAGASHAHCSKPIALFAIIDRSVDGACVLELISRRRAGIKSGFGEQEKAGKEGYASTT
jgi:hypothetical protein